MIPNGLTWSGDNIEKKITITEANIDQDVVDSNKVEGQGRGDDALNSIGNVIKEHSAMIKKLDKNKNDLSRQVTGRDQKRAIEQTCGIIRREMRGIDTAGAQEPSFRQ